MSKFKIHHVKFFEPKSTAIQCVDYEDSSCKLALSRADSSIEIWDLSSTAYQERLFTEDDNCSIEAIAWCNGRLFYTGLQAYVIELDVSRNCIKNKEPIFSGPAWCLKVSPNKTMFVVGAENGEICLFDIFSDKIKFSRTVGRQENRILSISWHPLEPFIVTGSLDLIQVWNVENGHSVQRMSTGRIEENQETIVWCIKFLSDYTIVSGDSRGKVCFWNGKTGSLLEAMHSHKADVLALAVDKDENKIYCSGIDPIIAEFSRIHNHNENSFKKKKWIKSIPRNIHTHDVRALNVVGKFLFSGGVDTYMVLSNYSPKVCLKYPCHLHKERVFVARKSRCIMFQYDDYIEIWKCGQTVCPMGNAGEVLPLSESPSKLLQLKTKASSKIICSAISEDASWIAYSTAEKLKVFQLSVNESNGHLPEVILTPVISLPFECKAASKLKFTPDGSKLIIVTTDSEIQVLNVDVLQPTIIYSFHPLDDSIHLLCISNDGKYIAFANHLSEIQVYDLSNFELKCTLPKYKFQPCAMTMHPDSKKILIAYVDHKVVEYDIINNEYTDWSRNLNLSSNSQWKNQNNVITNVMYDLKDSDKLIFQSDNTVTVLENSTMKEIGSKQKVRRKMGKTQTPEYQADTYDLRMTKKFKHLVYFGPLDVNEMIAVEVTPGSIFDKLPFALKKKVYGT